MCTSMNVIQFISLPHILYVYILYCTHVKTYIYIYIHIIHYVQITSKHCRIHGVRVLYSNRINCCLVDTPIDPCMADLTFSNASTAEAFWSGGAP